MTSPHADCIHHTEHDKSITRNEKDIQDIFLMIERQGENISKVNNGLLKIVTGMTALGLIGNYLIQTFGGGG